jgi:ABC-type Fe3+/spermidine/putrescine transport system ATPase subunit
MLLELHGIERSIDDQKILRHVSLSVNIGEIVALLGPSGCGKTTLLRIIAGLDTADAGQLRLDGQDLTKIPIHKRGFGLVFQDYALFPHKSVAENIAFGLRMMSWGRSRQEKRVAQVLQLVGLSGFEERRVFELSGGEQQRVALARSLAPSPRLVLLDEPLGALDRALREQLMGELRTILKQAGKIVADRGDMDRFDSEQPAQIQPSPGLGMTSIYVTHDQEEAFAVADRVIVMNAGKIEQEGTPVQLFRTPESRFVAHFLGMDNMLDATLLPDDPARVLTEIGELQLSHLPASKPGKVTLLVRPEAGKIVTKGEPGVNIVTGFVRDISFRGRHQLVTISIPTQTGLIHLRLTFGSSVIIPTERTEITVRLDPSELQLLAR